MKIALIVLIVLLILLVVRFWMMGKGSQRMNPGLGVHDGRFVACPASPNCQSSDADDEAHRAPTWTTTSATSMEQIAQVVKSMPGTRVTDHDEEYLRATVTSSVFGFVDDLELSLRENGKSLAVRSASRVGYSDLGANGKRVAALESALRNAGQIQ